MQVVKDEPIDAQLAEFENGQEAITDIHQIAQWERLHKVQHYKNLIEAKTTLLETIETELTLQKLTSPIETARMRVEAQQLRNDLFYHNREMRAAQKRAADYQAYMMQMATIASSKEVWEELNRGIDSALHVLRNNKPKAQEFHDIKAMVIDIETKSDVEKVNAFNLVVSQLAKAGVSVNIGVE